MARTAHSIPRPPVGGRPDPVATREAIVAATVRLIGRGGTALVTHRAVAAEAGVSLSSTTYHFASKDEIVDAALRSVAEREVERLTAAAAQLHDHGDVPEVIDATLDWLAAQLAEDDEVVRAGYHLQLETTRRPQLAEVHLAWARAVQRLAEEVLRAAGSPSPVLDARLLAAAIDGLRLEQLTMPGRAGGVESARPVVERLLRVLTGG
jgi:TetR/AcrR family transcriptional regulator, regulator of biofilm formation and stress response